MTKRQREALRRIRRTLKSIDWPQFWAEVMEKVRPKIEANERCRQLSYAAALKNPKRY